MSEVDEEVGDFQHAVIARYQLTGEGFGLESERAVIRAAQDVLREEIDNSGFGEFDGNEFGGGAVTLYAYGSSADELFEVMEPTLRSLPFRPAYVVLRYGPPGGSRERRIEL